jgi:hypothetical protein
MLRRNAVNQPRESIYAQIMPPRRVIEKITAAAAVLFLMTGCASTYQERDVTSQPTSLVQPASEIAENNLLGIRIHTLKPGELPEADKALGMSLEIRRAEGYFIAVKLKDTLQRSGHWGPVRVVPANSNQGEVVVSGEILESDGEFLELSISVRDATGKEWFSKEYSGVVNDQMYTQTRQNGDVFQFVYNEISNDIAAYRAKLASAEIATVRQVEELKLASTFAPSIFSSYLKETEPESPDTSDVFSRLLASVKTSDATTEAKPRYVVARLPSEDDPNYLRVQRIRAREHQLIDILDQQYDGLSKNISDAYTQWRISRLTEMNSVREIERLENERTTKAIVGGIAGVGLIILGAQSNNNSCPGCGAVGVAAGGLILAKSIEAAIEANGTAKADMEIHKRSLEELGQSLATEVTPIVIEVEGSTVELKGSADAKFSQWRNIMEKLHEREIGPIDDTTPVAVPLSSRGPSS